jgi:lysophospholipase L1-like esterase
MEDMTVLAKGDRRLGHGLAKRSFFVLVALVISLSLLELGSFLIWRGMVSTHTQKNVQALYSMGQAQVSKVPNTFWHHELNPYHQAYVDQLNAEGTKGKDFPLPKPPGEFRILCVGDSTVEGTGVQPDETFPYFLEAFLNKEADRWPDYENVRVINAGVGSHNSAFNLAYLAFRLIHFEPDTVVIKSSYNDYLPYCVPGMRYDYTHVFPNPYHLVRPSAYWSLAKHSHFLKIAGIVMFRDEIAIPFKDFSGSLTREQFEEMEYSANESKFFVYAENIRSMILLCKGRGIRVVLVDQPTSPDPSHFGSDKTFGPRFKNLIARLETELKRIATEENVSLIKTGPFTNNDFWDHCHCTAGGNKKVAQAIAVTLADHATGK